MLEGPGARARERSLSPLRGHKLCQAAEAWLRQFGRRLDGGAVYSVEHDRVACAAYVRQGGDGNDSGNVVSTRAKGAVARPTCACDVDESRSVRRPR